MVGKIDESTSRDLSPISVRTRNAGNVTLQGGPLITDGNSLLGVIVDRSSFDEDDELTTFGKDTPSVMQDPTNDLLLDDNDQPLTDVETGGNRAIVMKNGKVRRKLRWKPRFGRKRSNDNVSSNASVISALTNRSSATSRSSSTTRSFLSHFSRKSGTSFHTFHSTETPVVTNKANRPKAPQTVMRPNYQDSFDAKHSTIDTEGAYMIPHRRLGSYSSLNKLDSVSETMPSYDESSDLPDRLDSNNATVPISPRSPITVASPKSNDFGLNKTTTQNSSNTSNTATSKPPASNVTSKTPRPKRPPLFKRRLRNSNVNYKDGITGQKYSTNDNTTNRPLSPTDTSQTSASSSGKGLAANTIPTASLSASISIDRENSILPVLSGDEYEEDRRVEIPGQKAKTKASIAASTEEEKKEEDGGTGDLLLVEEGIEESSLSPADQSIQSANQSIQSGSTAAISFASAPPDLQGRRFPSIRRRTGSSSNSTSSPPRDSQVDLARGSSGGSSPSSSTASFRSLPTGLFAPRKPYNRPVDSSVVPRGPGDGNRKGTRNTVPVDLDEGAFLEAEHNLRAIHEMAAEHLTHGEYEEAIEVFEEILRGQQERYGQDHYRVGTALHNLGIVYLKKGDYRKAIEICTRAVNVRKEALVPNHPDVAVSLAQLGVAHLESRHFGKAIDAFRDALHIRQNFLGPRHPKCSKILNNIGCAWYAMERFEEAKRAFDEALDIQRDTLRNLPSAEGAESNGMQSNALLLSMASTLCNIGSIKLRWGDFDDAAIALDEALLIQQSVLGDNHPTVAGTIHSIELVETAKYRAENPFSQADFLIERAGAVCNSQTPTTMVEMLGLNQTLNAMAPPQQWFQNPCAPILYAPTSDNLEMKSNSDNREEFPKENPISPTSNNGEREIETMISF